MAQLTTIRTDSGIPFTVSADRAEQFRAFLNELEARGYPIQGNQSGGYNYRNIAGTNRLSEHAHGTAIDLNWDRQPRGGKSDIDPELARELAQKHGLTWGGDWKNPDPMHFEVARAAAPAQAPSALGGPPAPTGPVTWPAYAPMPSESSTPAPKAPAFDAAAFWQDQDRGRFADGGRVAEALRIAEKQVNRAPTDAQKKTGNYAMGHLTAHGLNITIENPKGGERSGVDKGGKRWSVKMPAAYGYVKGSEGFDGDHVDVYLGPDHDSQKVFVVDQVNADNGKFDEHKAMLSYPSKEAALADYQKAFSDGKAKDRIGAVTEMSVDKFREWVKSGDTKKPLGLRKPYAAGGYVHTPIEQIPPAPVESASGSEWFDNLSAAKRATDNEAVIFDSINSPWAPWKGEGYYTPRTPAITPDDLVANGVDRDENVLRTRDAYAKGGRTMPTKNQDAIAIALNIAGKSRQKKADGGRTGYAPGGWIGEGDSPADLTRNILLPGKAPPRVPLSGASGPKGEAVYPTEGTLDAPDKTPDWYKAIQPYSVNPAAAVEGLAMSSGMTGGPQGAITDAMKYLAKRYAAPTAVGLGGASLLASPAGSEDRPGAAMERMLQDKTDLMKQRAAAQADLDAQAKGGKGKDGKPIAAGRGLQYDAAAKRLTDIDTQLGETNAMIRTEQKRALDKEAAERKLLEQQSPEAKLKAEQDRKAFEDEQAAKDRGKPVRENLPGFLQDMVIPAATLAGYGLTRKIAGNANAEYAGALERFLAGQKTGNVPEMALAKAQLAKLEKPGFWQGAKTAGSAMLPAEIRGMETAIDLNKDPESRAYKEANTRIHDPWAVGRDIVTTGLSSGLAYGAGSKLAKPIVDRSLGKAIAENPNPYAAAGPLAEGYGSALRLTEDLGRLRQNAPGAEALGATPLASETTNPAVQRALDVVRNQRQLPAPEAVPMPAVSSQTPVKPLIIKESAAGYHYSGGHPEGKGGQFVPGHVLEGKSAPDKAPKSKKAKASDDDSAPPLKNGKANGKATDEIPSKPVRDFDPEDPINRGHRDGGSVNRGALDLARRYAAGGHVGEPVHVGGMVGATGGREDALPVSVPSGSFIIPADVVSALGQNNTLSGIKNLEKMFGPSHKAAGGPATPIQISDGEYIVQPEAVARIGGGDQDAGHRALDKLVLQVRKQHINELKKLPPPAVG